MNGLDLFSGIGGISIALAPWVRTIAYCEQNKYAQAVLLSRMSDGLLDRAPIWDNIKTLRATMLPAIDIIFGGFPCQDISVAGRGEGLAGERSGLVFEIFRLIDECKPTFVFLENVPAIRTRGGERVGKELARRGFDCRWGVISAAEVGAPHLRKRWFLLAADAERIERRNKPGRRSGTQGKSSSVTRNDGATEPMADTKVAQFWWALEPDVGRVAHGISSRVDRLRCLGNAVVPAQARKAFETLAGFKE